MRQVPGPKAGAAQQRIAPAQDHESEKCQRAGELASALNCGLTESLDEVGFFRYAARLCRNRLGKLQQTAGSRRQAG
jgi:hypothetical protein